MNVNTNLVETLLLEHLRPPEDAHILILEGDDGWLASQAAALVPNGQITSLARDFRVVEAAQVLLKEVPNATATKGVLPATSDWDTVLLVIPKERRYARLLLLAAWKALKPDGQLLLAGPTRGGAKAVIKDAGGLFGNASVLGYRRHQRVAVSIRGDVLPDHLPEEFQQPGIAPNTHQYIEITHPSGSLKLETHPGIFSWEELDEGTDLLLDQIKIKPGDTVWDIGCGYGVIGLTAALAGADFVAMSDTNLLAADYAHRNAVKNNLVHKVQVFPADIFRPACEVQPPKVPFSLILSNPAFHQGRSVDKSMAHQLITKARDHLTADGRLLVVANRFLNYHHLMHQYYKEVSHLVQTNKFHVIEARYPLP
jgi:16S rRNA (guanine1207-N2)-methyltransferase